MTSLERRCSPFGSLTPTAASRRLRLVASSYLRCRERERTGKPMDAEAHVSAA